VEDEWYVELQENILRLNQSPLLLTITSQNHNTIKIKIKINNTMSIVIEFIANTNYEIQI